MEAPQKPKREIACPPESMSGKPRRSFVKLRRGFRVKETKAQYKTKR
jgi:hypothetical protein